ncbi:hypothetical protein B2M20_00460 [Nitrobacter vulgaris]|uniref:Uncharacterized protein n=1 Tax=Nitrobacter vulgaris TaxID=29421 RepID=A0A1V4I482_NITVU|nr:hypothetical protein B2M20_00460 [Nitrobacter vulgaris]
MTMIEFPEPRNRHSTKLDHDDSGSNRSKIINVIDSDYEKRNAGGKPHDTFPHSASRGPVQTCISLQPPSA